MPAEAGAAAAPGFFFFLVTIIYTAICRYPAGEQSNHLPRDDAGVFNPPPLPKPCSNKPPRAQGHTVEARNPPPPLPQITRPLFPRLFPNCNAAQLFRYSRPVAAITICRPDRYRRSLQPDILPDQTCTSVIWLFTARSGTVRRPTRLFLQERYINCSRSQKKKKGRRKSEGKSYEHAGVRFFYRRYFFFFIFFF